MAINLIYSNQLSHWARLAWRRVDVFQMRTASHLNFSVSTIHSQLFHHPLLFTANILLIIKLLFNLDILYWLTLRRSGTAQ
jgi:hypothetical protein